MSLTIHDEHGLPPLGDDIVRGVKAIAKFTGEPERRATSAS